MQSPRSSPAQPPLMPAFQASHPARRASALQWACAVLDFGELWAKGLGLRLLGQPIFHNIPYAVKLEQGGRTESSGGHVLRTYGGFTKIGGCPTKWTPQIRGYPYKNPQIRHPEFRKPPHIGAQKVPRLPLGGLCSSAAPRMCANFEGMRSKGAITGEASRNSWGLGLGLRVEGLGFRV